MGRKKQEQQQLGPVNTNSESVVFMIDFKGDMSVTRSSLRQIAARLAAYSIEVLDGQARESGLGAAKAIVDFCKRDDVY